MDGNPERDRAATRRPRPHDPVLTLTLTGIAADSRLAGGAGDHPARRLISVTVMLAGAVLVLHVGLVLPLAIASALIAATALAAAVRHR
jgi:hypothetical protein